MSEGRPLPLHPAPDAIELRHLRAFVAVAEELNFGRAAARLYLSQPALSRQIRALERLIGCELLRRSTHRVELTIAGEALLEKARDVLCDLDHAISVTRSVGGELAGRVSRLWESVAGVTADTELQEIRDQCEALHAQFSVPPEVGVRPVNTGGVPSLLLTPGPERPATVLYLHGGGWVTGSAFGFRPLAGALAAAAEATIVLPEYRLAPEHPFPAALDDAQRAYLWMLDQGGAPERMTLAGDSSGAGLALSLLIGLKREGLPQPGRVVLLCPGCDLTFAGFRRRASRDAEPVIDLEMMRRFATAYLGGHPSDDPLLTPVTTDLTGLPPMLIQAGTGDPFLGDAERLADHARDQGVAVRLDLYPVPTHVFQMFWSFLPEAADALERAGRFIRDGRAPELCSDTA
jgi:epsilon-lactone hydrolase